jgi:hypothetical protein
MILEMVPFGEEAIQPFLRVVKADIGRSDLGIKKDAPDFRASTDRAVEGKQVFKKSEKIFELLRGRAKKATLDHLQEIYGIFLCEMLLKLTGQEASNFIPAGR